MWPKTIVALRGESRLQPKIRLLAVAFHMNVRGFVNVARVKAESVNR
jgi:hypothetical protein